MKRFSDRWMGGAAPVLAGLAVSAFVALAACGGGLSRSEVEEIVQDAASEPGLSRSEVEEIVEDALAGAARLSPAGEQQAEVPVPPKSDPVEYTKHFVAHAISRYETEGLQATLDYYNDPDNVDGQWYVFIIGDNDEVVGHYDPSLLGNDLNGWVGSDVNGYNFGSEMLLATEAGRWVTYVYRNPESGDAGADPSDFQLKNAWVVRHDGLLFGSGWYTSVDEIIKSVVAASVEGFRSGGLDASIEVFADPGGVLGRLQATLAYYESINAIDREWVEFVADADGEIVSAYYNPELLGVNIGDLLGIDIVSEATGSGNWITAISSDPATPEDEILRIWAVSQDGMTFGGGWYTTPRSQPLALR